jgi:hypothetical protein
VFVDAASHVRIAFFEHLNIMSVASDIIAWDDRLTVYIPHAAVLHVVQVLSPSNCSISDTINQMEEDNGK